MTAEFAVVLPAVMLCLALCLGAVQGAGQQVRLIDAAAGAARLLARGDDPQPAAQRVGAELRSERSQGLVCVRLTASSTVSALGSLGVSAGARSCVLDDTLPVGAHEE